MFLYDARGYHRFRRDVAHKNPFLKLPHRYERVAGKFHDIPLMREDLLHHRADIAVQSFRQFGRTANADLRILLREFCEACTAIQIARYNFRLVTTTTEYVTIRKKKTNNLYLKYRRASMSCGTPWFRNCRNNQGFHRDT